MKDTIKTTDASKSLALLQRLENGMVQDRFRLSRAIRKATKESKSIEQLAKQVESSCSQVAMRKKNLPQCRFPEELPITSYQEELIALIKDNPIIIVCGETGSGKSTQIPKLCLAAGYGTTGIIGQTQPRRIAARSVAERIAEEMGSPLGDQVGFRVRFSEKTSKQNYIRVLTDGMLLAEFESDRFLNRYDVLIIDEAHERSLNIDFLLGLAARISRQRPEFRLIITSATLDSEKFSKHFDNAPRVLVSGRTYPVAMRYQPIDAPSSNDDGLAQAIYDGVMALHQEAVGDVLVFLPGEREIREVSIWLQKRMKQGIEVLPLFARLTPKQQQLIFHPSHKSRVILSTNVAETSLTVPRVKYVIDSGLARVSRYSPSRKIQRLPIEKISQSAANQRAGRCGRVSNGICIRLFDEEDYQNRPQYTDPEILRASLADVILRMYSLELGVIEDFPFIDKPSRKQINDGVQQLIELGALTKDRGITAMGRQIARMPVDPRVARMLLSANSVDCLQEMVVIAAALSVPDPRLVPADKTQHARQVHREMSEESSDFMIMLDLWQQYRAVQKSESKRQAYRWCEENFLSVFRMREWGALQANIKTILHQLKFKMNVKPADSDQIHRALLPGLLSNVAQIKSSAEKSKPHLKSNTKGRRKKGVEYIGTFGKTLKIFPGSGMSGKTSKWIMCAELVETAEVYARMVGGLQVQWLESTGEHLLQYHYSDPRWEIKQERVIVNRRATLYGLPVYSGRKCDYANINAVDCRQIFIRSALVDGEMESRMPFLHHNRGLITEVESLEHKARRRDILADDSVVFDFYDGLIPDWVNSASSLRKWHRSLPETARLELLIARELLVADDQAVSAAVYPDNVRNNEITVGLQYEFNPGGMRDGVTAQIKLPLLNQMDVKVFERLVPGLLQEKLILLVRSLPKQVRRQYVPIPDTVNQISEKIESSDQSILNTLAAALNEIKQTNISAADFDLSSLPNFLSMGFELLDDEGNTVEFSRDLEMLKISHGKKAHEIFVEKGQVDIQREGVVRWDFGELPKSISVKVGEYMTEAYPALVDYEDSVSIEVFDSKQNADDAHQEGVRRLLWLGLPVHRKLLKKPLPNWQQISLRYAAIGDLNEFQLGLFYRAQDQIFFEHEDEVRDEKAFQDLIARKAGQLPQALGDIASVVGEVLQEYRAVIRLLSEHEKALPESTVSDVNEQLAWLVYDGFINDVPLDWLQQIPRLLKGTSIRLQQAVQDPAIDQLRQQKVTPWWRNYLDTEYEEDTLLTQYRWMVEEFRVSIFAQGLKTSIRISAKRLGQCWQEIESAQRG